MSIKKSNKKYDEEKLSYDSTLNCILWLKKNKKKISKYIICFGIIIEFIMVFYVGIIGNILNILTS